MAQPSHADPTNPFPPFLRYDTFETVGAAGGDFADAEHTNGGAAPIPVARLAAAKSTARKVYLDSLKGSTNKAATVKSNTPVTSGSSHSAPPSAAGGKRKSSTAGAAAKNKSSANNFGIKPFHLREGTTISHPHGSSTKGVSASTKGTTTRRSTDDSNSNSNSSSGAAAVVEKDNLPNVMKHTKDVKQILFTIFPPVTLEQDDDDDRGAGNETVVDGSALSASATARRKLVLQVSTQPTSREEVAALHQALLERLAARRARPTGICPIRRQIYQDLFQELIRQIALEEPARGVLTQRLRDELEASVELHSQLLARGDYFVSRKLNNKQGNIYANAHVAAEGSAAVGRHYGPDVAPPPPEKIEGSREHRIQQLAAEKQVLDTKKFALRQKLASLQKQFEDEAAQRRKHNTEELNYLRRINQQLSLRLKIETERVSGANAGGGTQGTAGAVQA